MYIYMLVCGLCVCGFKCVVCDLLDLKAQQLLLLSSCMNYRQSVTEREINIWRNMGRVRGKES